MEMIMTSDMNYVKKRKKPTLVCENCKRRKIKCDRMDPCAQCTKSNLVSSCVYSIDQLDKSKLPYMTSAKEPLKFDTGNQNKRMKTKERMESDYPKLLSNTINNVSIPLSQLTALQEKVLQLESFMKAELNKSSPHGISPIIESPESTNSSRSDKYSPSISQQSAHTSDSQTTVDSVPIINTSGDGNKLLKKEEIFHPNAFSYTHLPGKLKRSMQDMKALIGVHPYGSKNDFISFYEGYSSMHVKDDNRTINFGPFAWPSIMNKDSGLNVLWQTIMKDASFSKPDMNKDNRDSANSPVSGNSEITFRKKAMEDDGHEVYAAYSPKNNFKNADIADLQYSNRTSVLQILEEETPLIEKIRKALPNKRIIWLLINQFFLCLYLLGPFLEEDKFRQNIQELIGPETSLPESVQFINITKKMDLTQLGILFVIMRMTYLSYLYNKSSVNLKNKTTNDPSPEAQELKYILSHPIGNEATKLAQACFEQFQSLNQITLSMIQLVIYIKILSYYDPIEADQAGTQNQTMQGVILQMAYLLGLNREPDALNGALTNPKTNNLRRKLWCIILLWDINYRLKLGNPLMLSHRSWDTKFPFHIEGNENIRNLNLDKHVTEFYGRSAFISPIIEKILDQVLDISTRSNVAQLCGDLSIFENDVYREFGSLQECMNVLLSSQVKYDIFTHFAVKHFVTKKQFLQSIYYHLYLFYEYRDHKISFFYLKKLLLIACGDFMPSYFDLFDNEKFGADMLLNPSILNFIDKSNLVFQSLIIRAHYKLYKMRKLVDYEERYNNEEKFRTYYQNLCQLSRYLIRCIEISLSAISRLSHRYYHAWRIIKAHTYSTKIICNEPFYELIESTSSTSQIRAFALDEIEDLAAVCEIALDSLNSKVPQQDKSLYRMSTNEFEMQETPSESIQQEQQESKFNNNFNEIFDSREIDNLWLQLLNKDPGQPVHDAFDNIAISNSNSGYNANELDPMEFDIFNDLTFDQIFNYVNA